MQLRIIRRAHHGPQSRFDGPSKCGGRAPGSTVRILLRDRLLRGRSAGLARPHRRLDSNQGERYPRAPA